MQHNTDPPVTRRSYSVLVVEDEFLIAMDLERMLEHNGHAVIGVASSVDAAMRVLEGEQPDVAVLDVNLRGQPVIPVVERLRSLHVPFVLVSAYTSFDFEGSEVLEGSESVRKPFRERHLIEALDRATTPA